MPQARRNIPQRTAKENDAASQQANIYDSRQALTIQTDRKEISAFFQDGTVNIVDKDRTMWVRAKKREKNRGKMVFHA
jgi:hypothetical protein